MIDPSVPAGNSLKYIFMPNETKLQSACFGAGCFWGVEELFRQVPGVVETAVGFMGGTKKDPSYDNVCSEDTGHAEVVYLKYDPSKVSYEKLLKLFWDNHNPTTMNRQGPDYGSQYRSVIFFYTPEQEQVARASKSDLEVSDKYPNMIVTQIVPAEPFYRAEEYHQQYLKKRGVGTCHV